MYRFSQLLIPWTGVFTAALVTTAGAICLAMGLLPFFYQGEVLGETLRMTPYVTMITVFPFCFFVWAQVRHNILLSAELRALVERDRLTDVATRDYFFTRLNGQPDSYGVSLMVDIDHFKSVNDTYGHLAGDDVIVKIASILKQCVRKNDIICRFGGEEFVVFLHEADRETGQKIAERMRSLTELSETLTGSGVIKVTVSVGGSLKDRLQDIEDTIKRADDALYRAKNGGRNRVIFDPSAAATTSDSALSRQHT